jgi:hypothetical protein
MEKELAVLRDNTETRILIEKNLKWAEENNKLREELIHIEQTAIEGKMKIADLMSKNDRLVMTMKTQKRDYDKHSGLLQKKSKHTISKKAVNEDVFSSSRGVANYDPSKKAETLE